jgi:NitT/TauT family transport system ATP-binding protein
MKISIHNIYFHYGEKTIFRDFSLELGDTNTAAILGPSGCGKTTLLRLLMGLLRPESGSISFDGTPLVATVFQEHRLFPWLSARENISLPLVKTLGKEQSATAAMRFLELTGLGGRGDALPGELSGGEKQRVSIARAFAFAEHGGEPGQPGLILMDEPFHSLDIPLRIDLMNLCLSLIAPSALLLAVTHESSDAAYLGDRIIVVGGGTGETTPLAVFNERNTLNSEERAFGSPKRAVLEKRIIDALTNPAVE